MKPITPFPFPLSRLDTLRALALLVHPERYRLGRLVLKHGNTWTVTDYQAASGIPQAIVSQHLRLLFRHGLLDLRRDGNKVYYRLHNKTVQDLLTGLDQILPGK